MPRGSRHDEIGLLLEERGQLVLKRDVGGTWRLDVSPDARRLIGFRVRVEGIRADFDLLDITKIEAA